MFVGGEFFPVRYMTRCLVFVFLSIVACPVSRRYVGSGKPQFVRLVSNGSRA